MISSEEAIHTLQEGNRRYVGGISGAQSALSSSRRSQLAAGQEPFAIILGCSDSRVPGEIVFDQGLGDLFVIRVAGNIAAPSQIGSVEFAVAEFGTPLVVVLGHSNCGAIKATLSAIKAGTKESPGCLYSIVDRIHPHLKTLASEHDGGETDLVQQAVRKNIQASVEELQSKSDLLRGKVAGDELKIVGAEYDLETGEVEWL